MSNCSRRTQCTETVNGKQCKYYHHPLLHKNADVRVSISSVLDSQNALLPIISAEIVGHGLYKRGNVLLYSGAQLSLIRMETAESLGLDGKNVSITITKIGGEEEQMKTKEFKVQLTSLVNRRSFVMKAIGIPRISDDIAKISKEDAAKMSLLTKEKIYRASGGPTYWYRPRPNAHWRDETIRASGGQEFTAWVGGIWGNNQQKSRNK